MIFERPTYLINPDICRSNIREMAEKAFRSGVIFRPHFKTHQSLTIGHWFREAGVSSITESSLVAAGYFADDGWKDITVAFPVNLREIDRINSLASKINIGVTLEHPDQATELDRQLRFPVDAYIKIDTGYHRTGLTMDEMPVIACLADRLQGSSMIRLKGLLTHAGHTYHAKSVDEIAGIYRASVSILREVRDNLGSTDRKLILSYGDTPACSTLDVFDGIDEIRPGNFVFYDLMQMHAGVCDFTQVAGIVICPVVAVHPGRNQAVLYGGAIHFSKESIALNGRNLYGQMVEMDKDGWYEPVADAYLVSLTQEHGILEAPEKIINRLKPGSVIGILPVHACLTSNLIHGYQLLHGGNADYLPE